MRLINGDRFISIWSPSNGLGTCVIGSALPALNAAEIGIPADDSAVAPIIVGVPSGETPLSLRKEPTILVWT